MATRPLPLPVLALLVAYGLTEGLSALLLPALDARGIRYLAVSATQLPDSTRKSLDLLLAGRNTYTRHDPDLGWSIYPHGSGHRYQANGQGLRGDREYDSLPSRRRLAAFGDSFTHGDDVGNPDAWVAQLADDSTESLNFGVPFYGPDQALLRYERDGRRFHPHVVLIGFTFENIARSLSQYRPFYAPWVPFAFAKPGYRLAGDTLVRLPHPLPTLVGYGRLRSHPARVLPLLGADDWYYHHRPRATVWDHSPTVRLVKLTRHEIRRPITDAAGLRLSLALLDRFVARVQADGSAPVILLLPRREDLPGPPRYRALGDSLTTRGYDVLDLAPAFAGCGTCEALFVPGRSHYNPAGNRRVADYLRVRLGPRLTAVPVLHVP
jgi:hypothetical protein